MSDIHILDFYKDAAKTLLQLYKCFPRKDIVFVEDIAGPDDPDEFGLHSTRHQACFSSFLWLADSGYLSFDDTIRQEAIDQACLSHRAFTLLSAPAQDLQTDADSSALNRSQLRNINQLRQHLKSGDSYALEEFMQRIFVQSGQFR